jgi:hypothetical protein
MQRSVIWDYLIAGPWILFVAYWTAGALKTRRTVGRESLAWRYGVLFLEILGFVPYIRPSCYGGRAHLDRHCYRPMGPLASGAVLERQSHYQRGPQADPHWALCLFPASDLLWNRSRGGRWSTGD